MTESKLDWKPVVYEISQALVLESGYREALGQAIVDKLEIYGEFYDRLFNERKVDRELYARQIQDATPEVQATFASVTIGSLTLTAKRAGTVGNSISVTVSNGAGTDFVVPAVDEDANNALRAAADVALDGGPPLGISDDETIAQIQADAQAYLSSLDVTTREEARGILDKSWGRYSTASVGLDYAYSRSEIAAKLEELGIADLEVDFPSEIPVDPAFGIAPEDVFPAQAKVPPMVFYDTVIAQREAATASVFGLTVTRGTTEEEFLELVPGFEIKLDSSNLISSAVWDGNTRPDNGTYQMSGGTDGAVATRGKVAQKPDRDYILFLDSERSFSLVDLEEIVSNTLVEAERWLQLS